MKKTILAADIGGTKTDIGLFGAEGGALSPLFLSSLPTASSPSPEALIGGFLDSAPYAPLAAMIAVAGPVIGGEAFAPNLPWPVGASSLAASTGIGKLTLINDLVATAAGIAELGEGDLRTLKHGRPAPGGCRGLLAPGTGLGEAIIIPENGGWRPLPSEGGHADFAPADDEQAALLAFARSKGMGHASFERFASGPGLKLILDFLVETGRFQLDRRIEEKMASGDPSAVISEEGLKGSDPSCAAALGMFVSILGAEAGNLALKALATGGIYLGGGIVPKILPKLTEGPFIAAFTAKGRMTSVMESIPVLAITEPKTALYGAARLALRLIG